MLDGVARALELATPFTIHLDLREIRIPSRAIVMRGVGWAGRHAEAIDEHVQGICAIVPNRFVKAVVDVALRATQPPMPALCFRDEAAALEFARELSDNK